MFTVAPNTDRTPGYSFLTSVAAQARVVGACIKIHWNGTEMNRAGTTAFGSMQAGNINRGLNAMTADTLITLSPNKVRTQPGELEIRWNPAMEEEQYFLPGASTDANFDDRTALVFAYNGPAKSDYASLFDRRIEHIGNRYVLGLRCLPQQLHQLCY